MDLQILPLKERIKISLELGESHFREFKSCYEGAPGNKKLRTVSDVCKNISETLVAFANADGGELLVGVEDDGIISGFEYNDEKIDVLLSAPKNNIHKDTPLPNTRAMKFNYNGANILYFSISKGTDFVYLTSDGRCLQRKDRENIPRSSEHIRFSREEKLSREYDREFVDNATLDDIKIALIKEIANQISKGMSAEKCLQHLDIAEFDGSRLKLRRAALLLFAKNAQQWHPRLQVRILKINGEKLLSGEEYNVMSDNYIAGNIIELLENSWDLLRPYLTETRFTKTAMFKTQIIYPELACKEALINAIAHRDYNNEGRGIEISVYTNRLDISSPGGLLSSININDLKSLKGVHQSRNSLIARVLREIGYMRELGEGMRRIHELMKTNDLTAPELSSDKNSFTITLHHKFIYSQEEKLWLDNFSKFNLSREQKTIVRLGYNNHIISPKEIWDSVGIVDTDNYRQIIENMNKLGILERVVNKSTAYSIAQRKGISKKSVPQYQIKFSSIDILKKDTIVDDSKKGTIVDDSDYTKIHISNLPFEINESKLKLLFEQYGKISDICLPINYETNSCKGYAFIEYESSADVKNLLLRSGEIIIDNRKILINKAYPRRD